MNISELHIDLALELLCPIGITWALIGLMFVTPFHANVSPGMKSMDIYLKQTHLHCFMMHYIIILISLGLSISEILSLSHPLKICHPKDLSF